MAKAKNVPEPQAVEQEAENLNKEQPEVDSGQAADPLDGKDLGKFTNEVDKLTNELNAVNVAKENVEKTLGDLEKNNDELVQYVKELEKENIALEGQVKTLKESSSNAITPKQAKSTKRKNWKKVKLEDASAELKELCQKCSDGFYKNGATEFFSGAYRVVVKAGEPTLYKS